MDRPVYIIINPNCNQGRGWKRWLSIRSDVSKQLLQAKEIVTEKGEDLSIQLKKILESNEEAFIISAGGDGSIHTLVNMLLKSGNSNKKNISIGAIGLGSSNDFLKPFQSVIKNIPVRINIARPYLLHDVGKAVYLDEKNNQKEKLFIINASFGVTAEGNWNFNNPRRLLKWLKTNSTRLAISYTAISTILSYKNKYATIRFNGEEQQLNISNINILKIPYVSGSLHYKQAILRDDGRLGLNICFNMNKRELLQTLFNLEKGRFTENNKRISTFANDFQLVSDIPIVFECDGETEKATCVQVSVIPKAIKILGN
ncbi:MAG: diacylglycerol kinase family protein [Chitinophagaceae bacterium]